MQQRLFSKLFMYDKSDTQVSKVQHRQTKNINNLEIFIKQKTFLNVLKKSTVLRFTHREQQLYFFH